MKITIQTFSETFSEKLEPFGDELAQALSALPHGEGVKAIEPTRLGLKEVQQRLSTLREKVSRQRTFLLIFGPLKSGKSTLMNALSGAYVSEVSSLPAYPALVYVKHGEQRRFEATDYEGGQREFADNLALADAVESDHAQLADAIVAAENLGETFEPKKHYPKAIRRMDIEVPAAHLAESGSVLVDTPGLYSRMRFGYDQMTKDFRDTAACAIFVVKTDNLFFEKVFEEFEELLSCFTRIFLVSNIDSSKKDLRPDGTLEASLESREPERIIDAFRSLSMSATLRGAIEDGRLKIYPIDLLRAASKTLRSAAGAVDDEPDHDPSLPTTRDDGFGEFVSDLTAYLNSSDYLHDFMVDSLRLAQDLTAEAGMLVSGDAAAELSRSNRQTQDELEKQRARLSALQTLEKQDWREAFEPLMSTRDALLEEAESQHAGELEKSCQEQLTAWMESDESWNALLGQRLNPQLQRESARQTDMLRERLRTLVEGRHAGAEFSEAQLAAFRAAELSVEEPLAAVTREFGAGKGMDAPRLAPDADDIPVARTLGDLLLLRGRGRIRDEIFGDEGNCAIDPAVKEKRLGGEGLARLNAILHETAASELPDLQRRHAGTLLEAHVGKCTDALKINIDESKTRLQKELAGKESTLKLRQQAQKVFEELQSTTVRFDIDLDELKGRFDL